MLENRKIEILDSTLREGEQTPGVLFTLNEKLDIAKKIDLFGVDFIEIGHPAVAPDIYEAVEALNSLELNSKKIVHGRATKSDINDAKILDVEWIGIFYGTSPLSRKYKHNVNKKEALNQIESSIKYAKDQGLRLRFTAEDSSRTEIDFLIEVGILAQKAGADRYSLADTVGCLTPTKIKNIVKRITSQLDIPVHVHCHNDFGMGTANSLSAIEAGAQCIDLSINGLGERSGLPPLAEVVAALVNIYKIKDHSWKLKMIPELTNMLNEICNSSSNFNQPIIGKNVFTHKGGIHAKSVLKNPKTYEPFSPEIISRKRRFVINKYSGKFILKEKLKNLQLKLTKVELENLLKEIKSFKLKNDWSDDELYNLVNNTKESS